MNKRRPIGATRRDKDGYIIVKVAQPNKWRRAHIVLWEKHNGALDSRKDIVLFLDGNRDNVTLENLYKIPRKYIGIMNELGYSKSISRETIQSIIAICDLHSAAWAAEIEQAGGDVKKAQIARSKRHYHEVIKKDPVLLEKRREYYRKHKKGLVNDNR